MGAMPKDRSEFHKIMETTLREPANENRPVDETVNALVFDLSVAGFAIKRAYDPVDYHMPVAMMFTPPASGNGLSPATYAARFVLESPGVADLRGETGFLVLWQEKGRTHSGWFDAEGISPIHNTYRVINPRTPVASAVAAMTREVA